MLQLVRRARGSNAASRSVSIRSARLGPCFGQIGSATRQGEPVVRASAALPSVRPRPIGSPSPHLYPVSCTGTTRERRIHSPGLPGHHRELRRSGDEAAWWERLKINQGREQSGDDEHKIVVIRNIDKRPQVMNRWRSLLHVARGSGGLNERYGLFIKSMFSRFLRSSLRKRPELLQALRERSASRNRLIGNPTGTRAVAHTEIGELPRSVAR
jgi:hypothetical protein